STLLENLPQSFCSLINLRKLYLNQNVKYLINMVKIFGENGKIDFKVLLELAKDEQILERKFYTYLNQACYQGYLRKQENYVHLIMDYE
ncbi:MAG: hypothetical protein ACFFG0_12920, partial [Candidatus Thorarchaeota archaeon]